MIDLHTHSRASDGTDRPAELVAKAAAAGLTVLGLTDHDTTAGWDEARAALRGGMTLVTGTEFSCAYAGPDGETISLHLLGYLFDRDDERLRGELSRLRASRFGRSRAIVDNLAADGIPIRWNQVAQMAAGSPVGRPHIARVLVENGVVPSVDEAFRRLLSGSSKYHVAKADADVFDVIALVRAARGVSVFAHPLARQRGAVVGEDVIAAMARAGLHGIEVDHPDHAPPDRAHLASLADELGLAATGSSDYHGTNRQIRIGMCTTPRAAYEQLFGPETAHEPVTG